jgi:plastocyanin
MEDTSQQETAPKPTEPKKSTKRKFIFGISILLAILLTGVGVAWYLQEDRSADETTVATEVPQDADTNFIVVAEVQITDEGFSPASLQIRQGGTVTWKNGGTKNYSISSQTSSGNETNGLEGFTTDEALNPGESFSFTFESSGVFPYSDPNNPTFSGEVIVE